MATVNQLPCRFETLAIGSCQRHSAKRSPPINPLLIKSNEAKRVTFDVTQTVITPPVVSTIWRPNKSLIKESKLKVIKQPLKSAPRRRAKILRDPMLRLLKTDSKNISKSLPVIDDQSKSTKSNYCSSSTLSEETMNTVTPAATKEDIICTEIKSIKIADMITSPDNHQTVAPELLNSNETSNVKEEEVDCNVDELACYLDTMVYIPKEMSAMAEMMYT